MPAVPDPISLCVENLEDDSEQTRFIRCVALAGNLPGLGIDRRGRPLWRASADVESACRLWVSADDRLMLWRTEGAPPVTVRRARRSLAAPEAKPVVILDQDEVEIAGVRLRLHVHGVTTEVHPPMPLRTRALGAAATIATALALSAAGAGCDRTAAKPDETPLSSAASLEPSASAPSTPPEPTAPPSASSATATVSATSSAAASASSAAPAKTATKTAPIKVRKHPPMPID